MFRRKYFTGLRTRLLVLVFITLLPAFGLAITNGLEERRLATASAQADALRLAHLISTNHEKIIEDSQQLLFILAQFLQFREFVPDFCNELLARFGTKYPNYTTIFLVGLQGQVLCASTPLSGPISFADRTWFKQALETGEFTVGEYQTGRISGRAVLPLAYPILDPSNTVQSVLATGLDLEWLNQLTLQVELPAGSSITVIDPNKTILYRYPDPQDWVGKIAPEISIMQTALAGRSEDTTEATGLDGVRRLYAFMPLGVDPSPDTLYLFVGIPTGQAYLAANHEIIVDIVLLVLVLALSASLAWIGGEWFLLRQIKELVGVSRRLEAGDLSARSGLASEPGEIGQLAHAFNDMAKALRELAVRDELTGLYNRRELIRMLDGEMERFHRHGRPLSIAMLDIDHFKDINDAYGHPVGDSILKEFAQLLFSQVRSLDRPARYGGDEFTIIMPETNQSQAVYLAERIRLCVIGHTFTARDSHGRPVDIALTVTIGVGEVSSSVNSKQALMDAVDQMLYNGKRDGRNCTVST